MSLSRRGFLAGALLTGAGTFTGGKRLRAAPVADPHRVALLADTHISADLGESVNGTTMSKNLREVVDAVSRLDPPPAAVMVDGDCAYMRGREKDYSALEKLLEPLRRRDMPIQLAPGNHDHRDHFCKAFPMDSTGTQLVAGKRVTVLEAERANWFVLDSLDKEGEIAGRLGEAQLAWLAGALDARSGKPALVMAHHNPYLQDHVAGLVDPDDLFAVLAPRKQVKAYFHGHTHSWSVSRRDGLYLVSLPPVSYVFSGGKPNGWVDFRLRATGGTLELRSLDPSHPEHGRRVDLEWRT